MMVAKLGTVGELSTIGKSFYSQLYWIAILTCWFGPSCGVLMVRSSCLVSICASKPTQ